MAQRGRWCGWGAGCVQAIDLKLIQQTGSGRWVVAEGWHGHRGGRGGHAAAEVCSLYCIGHAASSTMNIWGWRKSLGHQTRQVVEWFWAVVVIEGVPCNRVGGGGPLVLGGEGVYWKRRRREWWVTSLSGQFVTKDGWKKQNVRLAGDIWLRITFQHDWCCEMKKLC